MLSAPERGGNMANTCCHNCEYRWDSVRNTGLSEWRDMQHKFVNTKVARTTWGARDNRSANMKSASTATPQAPVTPSDFRWTCYADSTPFVHGIALFKVRHPLNV